MFQEASSKNDLLYAEYYSSLPPYSGSRFVMIRDVPHIIKQYVKGKFALDYGCGAGQSSLFLKNLGFSVEGVDINKYMIEEAKKGDTTGVYSTICSGEIPAEDDHYDFVYSCLVLMHIQSKGELLKVVQEVARVLTPGGTFIAVVNNKDAYNNDWYSIDTRFEQNKNLTSGSIVKILLKENNFNIYVYYWSEEDYREVIEKAGLKVVHMHRPLGTKFDGYDWISEFTKSYVTIFVAQK